MDVSVIIVNYNTKELTQHCIDSVFEKTSDITYEVILVDNASSDGSKIHFENDTRITYIYSNDNLGFGRANNLGFKYARGRNILCLNSDTLLMNNAIKILSDFLDNNCNVGVCGGNLYDKDFMPMHSFRIFLPSITWEVDEALMHLLSKFKKGKSIEFNYTWRPMKVGYITGADMMIKKSVLDIVEGFSPLFFMYYEEAELAYRIKNSGYLIYSVPDAKIQHLEGASFQRGKTVSENRIRLSEESRSMYYKIHYSRIYRNIANDIHRLNLKIRLCIWIIFNPIRANSVRICLKHIK